MTIIEELSVFAKRRFAENIDEHAAASAKLSIYDSIGCMIAGSRHSCFHNLREYLEPYGGAKLCSVLAADGLRTDPEHAASMNAMAAHILDYDDMCAALYGHATSGVLSAAMAIAEMEHCSGKAFLHAFMVGADVAALMGIGVMHSGYPHALDSSATLTIVGTAVVAGLLMNLDQERLENAIAIAISEGAGFRANYGTLAKDLTAGRTPARGIYAANMAKLGFDANHEVIENANGMLAAVGARFDHNAVREKVNSGWSVFLGTGMRVKNYPTCGGTHCAMDAVIQMTGENGVCADDVRSVTCIAQSSAKSSDKYPMPKTPMQGKFSLAYCIAVALLYGRGELDAFVRDEFPDRRLLELASRVSVRLDDSLFTDALDGAKVTLHLKDGREMSRQVNYCTGSAGKELSLTQRIEKFALCTEGALPKADAQRFFNCVHNIENYADAGELIYEIVSSVKEYKG